MKKKELTILSKTEQIADTAEAEFVKGCDLLGRALMVYLALKSIDLVEEQSKPPIMVPKIDE